MKSKRSLMRGVGFCLVILTILKFTGCSTTPPDSSSALPLTRDNWWNRYERGLKYQKQGRYQEALVDFKYCLGWRYGYAKDRWRVRTYGIHILENYFPYRETGVCLFELGDRAAAEEHLSKSLEQQPSSRAKHYLNNLHAQAVRQKKTPHPVIQLDKASETRWTAQRKRTLSGKLRGLGYINKIQVADSEQFNELAEQVEDLSQRVDLDEGLNTIRVVVSDLAGHRVETNVQWIADFTPPTMKVFDGLTRGASTAISIVCEDDQGLARIEQGRRPLFVHDEHSSTKKKKVDIRRDGGLLRVSDLAGNVLEIEAAELGRQAQSHPGVSGPHIDFRNHQKHFFVYSDEFQLTGLVTDDEGVSSLQVNGAEQLTDQAPAQAVYFSTRIELEPGTNQIQVVIQNKARKQKEERLEIVRKEPAYEWDEIRLRTVIPTFKSLEASASTVVQRGMLKEALQVEPVRFYVLNREKKVLTAIEQEHFLNQLQGLVDPRARLRIKAILNPDFLFEGSLKSYRDGVTLRVNVSRNTDEELFVEDIFLPGSLAGSDMEYYMKGLALKLGQRFPLMEGVVRKVGKKNVFVEPESNEPIRSDTPFIIARPNQQDDGNGLIHEIGDVFVQFVVEKQTESTLIGRVEPGKAQGLIQPGDVVYAR